MKVKNFTNYLKYVFLMLAVPVLIQVLPVVSAASDSGSVKDQTIMIYMIGADLESFSGSGTKDLKEMMDADINTDTSNVLVYTGGCSEWKNNVVSSEYNTLFYLQHGSITETARTDHAEDMGNADTLTDFLIYSAENYPAESYSLILWDHGGGPLLGYGSDENYSGDRLELSEIRQALLNAGFGADRKLEVIGFDACLMGSIEVAYALSDFAEYMVASEETEDSQGWNYEFLSDITDNTGDGRSIGKSVIDSYRTAIENRRRSVDAILSCIDLSYLEKINDQLGILFSDIVDDIDTVSYTRFAKERSEVKAFGKSDQIDPDNYYDVVDLTDMISQLSADYPEKTEPVLETLEKMTVESYSNMDNANGLSIYYPYENTSIMESACRYYAGLGFCQPYYEYIKAFVDILTNGAGTGWDISSEAPDYESEEELTHLSFLLTEEQMTEYDSATFYILVNSEEYNDAYVNEQTQQQKNDDVKVLLYYSDDVLIDDNGLIQADYDGRWFTVNGTDRSGSAVKMGITPGLLSKEDGLEHYSFSIMLYRYPDRNNSYGFEMPEECEIFFTLDTETGIVTIDGCRLEEENSTVNDIDLSMSSKGLVTLDELKQNYQYLVAAVPEYIITRDDNGNIPTTDNWEITSMMYISERMLLENGIKINAEKLDQLDSMTCIFRIKDLHQRSYMSDYIDIPISFRKDDKEMLNESLDYQVLASETFGIKEEVVYRYHFNKDREGNWLFRYEYPDESGRSTEIKIVPFENLTAATVYTDYLDIFLNYNDAIRSVYFAYCRDYYYGDTDKTEKELLIDFADERKEFETDLHSDYEYSDIVCIEENGREYAFWLESRGQGDDYISYRSKIQIYSLQDISEIDRIYLNLSVEWSEATENENFRSMENAEKIVREIVSHIT